LHPVNKIIIYSLHFIALSNFPFSIMVRSALSSIWSTEILQVLTGKMKSYLVATSMNWIDSSSL